ncbi:dCTP deaminase [bacterium MnTg04]|nr:dCTP deaminase [bacterium MnTg04]
MRLLTKKAIEISLESDDQDSLFVDPLLDREQIGPVSLDLRLGYDFQVSILTRRPSIDPSDQSSRRRSIASYFQETRRDLGDRFVLYPDQVVVTTTLEYVSLPTNVYADILTRSSYTRLGIQLNTMVQPGWRGCMPLELCNHGSTPIEIVVGARLVQVRLFEIDEANAYSDPSNPRKYHGNVRPTVSRARHDDDLARLVHAREQD